MTASPKEELLTVGMRNTKTNTNTKENLRTVVTIGVTLTSVGVTTTTGGTRHPRAEGTRRRHAERPHAGTVTEIVTGRIRKKIYVTKYERGELPMTRLRRGKESWMN